MLSKIEAMEPRPRTPRQTCMLSDVRHALRLMRRSPALTAVALASVAIGTSASAVVFAAVKAVLLQPLPYAKASELVELRTDFQRGNPREDWVSWSDAKDAVERGASFDSSGTYHYAV